MRVNASWALIALLLAVTIARNAVWADDGRLWNDIIGKSPGKARAYNEYGLHVLEAGDIERALRLLGRSLEIDRYQPQLYVNIGLAYEKRNETEKAITAYERAIFIQPMDPTAYYNLGVLYSQRFKDNGRAYGYFIKARDLNPYEPDVHQHLSRIYQERGDPAKAAEEMALSNYYRR